MATKKQSDGFIVVYDDEQGLCVPFGWDDDCDGALCCDTQQVAVFATRQAAREAIEISKRFNALLAAQRKPVNTDFRGPTAKYVKIVPLASKK